MVNLNSRLEQLKKMVDKGSYFAVNRARQYGKTTMLAALADFLKNEYRVIFLDFQIIGSAMYENEDSFSRAFADCFLSEFDMEYKNRSQTRRQRSGGGGDTGETRLRNLRNPRTFPQSLTKTSPICLTR